MALAVSVCRVNTTRNVRIKEIKYWDDLGLKTDIPRTIILQTVAVRMYHCRKDLVSPFKSGDYFTIGGVLFIECLEVPSLPKPLKSHVPDVKDSGNWNVVMITKEKGECVPYLSYYYITSICLNYHTKCQHSPCP